jgi:hypothetical protein
MSDEHETYADASGIPEDDQPDAVSGGEPDVEPNLNPDPDEVVEVRPGMAADDAEAALEQGVIGSDPEWGPLGLDENESARRDVDGDVDPVAALKFALISGNQQDALAALALVEDVEPQAPALLKRDLPVADEDEDIDDEDES